MHLNTRAFRSEDKGAAEIIPFSGRIDLSHISRWGETPFPNPVSVEGTLSRQHGEITLDYTVEYLLCGSCARCLAEVEKPGRAAFSHIVTEDGTEDDPEEWLRAEGGRLDMTQAVGGDLLLSLDLKLLCGEDCKGLCPHCGQNRNTHPCDCESGKKTDPRFEALLEYLE